MVNIYNWDDIKKSVSIHKYLEDQGVEIKNGRCAAVWRDGDRPDSVSIGDDGLLWHDFKTGQGGTVIDLCAEFECGGDRHKAVRMLGDRYNVTPKATAKKVFKSRGQCLIEDGYVLKRTYTYTDANGAEIYFVDRYEHPEKGKTFVQRTKDGDGLRGVTRLLYNLPAVINANEVFIVEGEKDVETLRDRGIVATTNSGGAENWDTDFNAVFDGKDIVVVADNDEKGYKHAGIIYAMLMPVAHTCKLLTVSKLPKGDITDWFEKEGGTIHELREMLGKTENVEPDTPAEARAKLANATAFTNYQRGGKKKDNIPIGINLLVEEVHNRFLGYPRVIGESMFDWRRKENRIMNICTKNDLFAWIQSISGHNVDWGTGSDYITKDELFCALQQNAIRYSGIATAPHYPSRSDIFYINPKLPSPDPTHSSFWKLVDFFCPANNTYRTLIATFIAAPIFFDGSNDRPMWIIDTDDAQGSGKTSLVKVVSRLYGGEPLDIDMRSLDMNPTLVTKRLISFAGRQKRVALIDNATGTLRSPNLAQLVTASTISGLAPYGRMEETRPNDITYVVTVNGASTDTDTSSRAYTVRLKAPKAPSPTWASEVNRFVDDNRSQIFADIIHMLDNNALSIPRPKTRFGMFDKVVLSAMCKDKDEFDAVNDAISHEKEGANEDQDRAQEFVEMIDAIANESQQVDQSLPYIISNKDIDRILAKTDGAMKFWSNKDIRALVKQGQITNVSRKFERIPKGFNISTYHAFFYGMDKIDDFTGDFVDAQVLSLAKNNAFHVVKTIQLRKRSL